MKRQYLDEIKGIIILAAALILLASLISFVPQDLPWYTSHPNVPAQNLIRVFGAYMAGTFFFVFGYSAYLFGVSLCARSWDKFTAVEIRFSVSKIFGILLTLCSMSALLGMISPADATIRFQRAGIVVSFVSEYLTQ